MKNSHRGQGEASGIPLQMSRQHDIAKRSKQNAIPYRITTITAFYVVCRKL